MKRARIELINDDLSGGSNAEIGLYRRDPIGKYFRGWYSQLGEKNPLGLDRGRFEFVEGRNILPKGR